MRPIPQMRLSLLFALVLLTGAQLLGQTGPFGIGNSDGSQAPAGYDQPRLLLWLDGESAVRSSGFVTQWTDKSGNDHHFLPPTSSNRPTWQATAGPAGTSCVSFDGVDDRLVCNNMEMTGNGFSIFYVFQTSDNFFGFYSYGTSSDPDTVLIYNDSGIKQRMGSSERNSQVGNESSGNWEYFGMWWNRDDNRLWEYEEDGTHEASNSFANSFLYNQNGTGVIGDIPLPGGGYETDGAFSGQIAEVIIWEGHLTRPIARMMRTYLWTKYGQNSNNLFREGNSGWDKFQGYASGSGGEHYEPIAVGRDNGGNPGEHCESRLNGLVLRVDPSNWTQGRTYLCAASPEPGDGNSIVTTNVPAGVEARWSRTWEIAAANDGSSQQYRIGFDFGEGIDGDNPQVVDNYVLLRKTGTGGSFSEFPESNIIEKAIVGDEVVFTITKSNIRTANRYYTLGTKNQAVSSLDGSTLQTWYAYQSGNWSDPATWTLDGSAAPAYVNPGSDIPSPNDNIMIGSGRTVTLDIDGINQGALQLLGTLDVGTRQAPQFGPVSGNGTIRCAGNGSTSNFPIANTDAFADENNGGRVEFYGSGSNITQSTNLELNDVQINFSSSGRELIFGADFAHNGFLEINTGTLRINNGSTSSRTLTSFGDVYIGPSGRIRVSAVNEQHEWRVEGNIDNDGDVRLTQRTAPDYSNSENQGWAELRFTNSDDNQTLNTNGNFFVSRLVVNKGIDKTYRVQLSANAPDLFRVLGRCTDSGASSDYETESQNSNAVAIINGTLQAKENIFLPLQIGSGANYNINRTAALWIDGGSAAKGAPLVGPGNSQAIVIYGEVRITDGELYANTRSGFTLRGNGLLQVDGGTVYANQIRTSVFGPSNIGGYIQNGGDVYVDGSDNGGTEGSYYVFSLSYTGNLFQMSGGNLHITGANGRGLIWINSDPAQTSVSGGTVHIDVSTTSGEYKITSRAPFWNLRILRSASSGSNRPVYTAGGDFNDNNGGGSLPDLPLHVRNALTITGSNNPILQMGPSSASSQDLFVEGNMTIESGGQYVHFSNTTHFIGNSNSLLSFQGTTHTFYNVLIEKSTDSRYAEIQTSSASTAMDILANLRVEQGYLENNNRSINVRGNITNFSRLGNGPSSTGDVIMNGSDGEQRIISQDGTFHGLLIDNPDGVRLENDGVTIKRRLRIDDGLFFIGDHKLRMETTLSPFSGTGASNFIACSGNPSAGGIEIFFHSASQNSTFPFGVASGAETKYTPAVTVVNGSFVDSGYVQITPVDTVLPTTDLNGGEPYLNFYWRVSHRDFDNLPAISHRFQFDYTDTVGTASALVSGRVLSDEPFDRQIDDLSGPATNHVDVSSRFIFYNGTDVSASSSGNGTTLTNASYSAGNPNRFDGAPQVLFSKNPNSNASWNSTSSWTEYEPALPNLRVNHSSGRPSASTVPGPGSIVYIGYDPNSPDFRPHSYAAPISGIEAAEVRFTPMEDSGGNPVGRYNGSNANEIALLRPTLRLSNTSQLGEVREISGEGALLLTADVDLSIADIGGFLAQDSSIIVIQSSSSNLGISNLPVNIPNLFLTSSNNGADDRGISISSNIVIRGNLEIAGNANLRLSSGAQGNITVNGDLKAGQYQSTTAGAQIIYPELGTSKSLSIQGDLYLTDNAASIEIFGFNSTPPPPTPWTPSELSPFLWFDADDASTITESGGVVSQWNNKGSASLNAGQTNNSLRPAYQTSGLNGLNTLRFDGTNDFLSIPHTNALNIPANQDFEIFTVTTPFDKQARAIYAKGGVHSTDFTVYYWSNNYTVRFNGGAFSTNTGTGNNSDPNIGWVRRQGANGLVWNSSGGTSTDNSVGNAVLSNTFDASIGAFEEGTGRFFDGDIAEILLVKRALSTDEREKLEGFLAHKWGLEGELPNGHPYAVSPPSTDQDVTASHILEVKGDIVQNISGSGGIDLYNPASFRTVNLILTGNGNHSFVNSGGPAPDLWKMTVDKGFDLTSSFSWNTDVNIFGPSNEADKPVDLRNGLLIFDNSAIDITLTSGGGDYTIPGTAGVELNDGTLRVNGANTGMLLDGLLELNGGLLEIGNALGEDNYIEYSSNGTAKLLVTNGVLQVGSQIRRGLTNTAGILDFQQSGGSVEVGRFSAPVQNRGVFEIINSGSRFDQTGGTLTLVRGVNSSSTPSLILMPQTSTVSGNSEIIIGTVNSPAGGELQNFGIQANVALNRLLINNDSGNDPEVRVQVEDLEINDLLSIDLNSEMNLGTRDLLMNGDIENDGLLSNTSGSVFLNHPTTGSVSGAGVFSLYDLVRQGGATGTTSVDANLTVLNDFTNDEGTIDFGMNNLTVQGDVFTDGHLVFDASSQGLIFSGSEEQGLDQSNSGVAKIDVLTLNNSSGVAMNTGSNYTFQIDEKLRMDKGVLKLNGNLLELGVNSEIEQVNPFGPSNMISTGGAFTNFGVRKYFPANVQDQIVFIPLGLTEYMPVIMDFEEGGSSGNTPSDYLFKLNIPEHPIIQTSNTSNVLGMYFSMEANNIGSGLDMTVQFQYDENYVQVTSLTEEDYITARVFNTDVFKNGGTIDANENLLSFDFNNVSEAAVSGDYFAGIDNAIPDLIPVYSTNNLGGGNVEDAIYTPPVPGGGAPNGAIVNIVGSDILNFNVDGISFYQTNISTDATLEIDQTTFHRLGTVMGDGTIKLNGTGTLPSGVYNAFFTCTGGSLIFEGFTGNEYDILANLPIVRSVDLIGSGVMRMSNNDVTICEDFSLDGPTFRLNKASVFRVDGQSIINSGSLEADQGDFIAEEDLVIGGSSSYSSGNDGTTIVEGDLLLGGSEFNLGSLGRRTIVKGNVIKTSGDISGGLSGAALVMDGDQPQYISGAFTGINNRIRNLEISNPIGVQLYDNVEVTDTLQFVEGKLYTGIDSLIFLSNDGVDIVLPATSNLSFVEGPMEWTLGTIGSRVFPIGKNDRYRPLTLLSGRSSSRTWRAEYFDTLAVVEPAVLTMDPSDPISIKTVSIQEYWKVDSKSMSSTTADVGLSWGENSAVSALPGDQSKLVVLAYNEGLDTWDSFGGDGHSGTATNGSFHSEIPMVFSERIITLGSEDAINPLPVSWLYFEGETENDNHILSWATATELDNDYFILERSINASDWAEIAQISGAGNSSVIQYYSFADHTAPAGIVYYRLKQVDFDGDFDYAPNIVSLERIPALHSKELDFVVYPNPTYTKQVQFLVGDIKSQVIEMTVFDLSGKVVDQDILWLDDQGISNIVNCNFEPGIYLISLTSQGKTRTKKLVVSN